MVEASNVGCDVRTLQPPPKDHTKNASTVTVGFHANLYESSKLKGIDGGDKAHDAASSLHRMARMAQLPPATSTDALLSVVSDTHDPTYPIHRNGTPPDLYMTLNSVLFDAAKASISVWGQTSPRASGDEPRLTIDWRTLHITEDVHVAAAR